MEHWHVIILATVCILWLAIIDTVLNLQKKDTDSYFTYDCKWLIFLTGAITVPWLIFHHMSVCDDSVCKAIYHFFISFTH